MVLDEPGDPRALVIRELELAAEVVRDVPADLLMVVEAEPAIVDGLGRRLADVVQQRGEGQREARLGGQELQDQQDVVPEVAFGLDRLALEDPLHRDDWGQHGRRQAGLEHLVGGLGATGVHEHPPQFGRDPLGGDHDDLRRHRDDRCAGRRLDRQPEPRREPDGAEEAELVLAEPGRGVADGAEDAVAEVGLTPDVVDHLAGGRIEEHTIDREVAPRGVDLGRAEDDRLGMTAVDIRPIAPEGGHLHLLIGLRAAHPDHPKRDPHGDGPVPEHVHDLLGAGVGGHVVVAGRQTELEVPDTTPGPEGLEPSLAKSADDVGRELATLVGAGHDGGPSASKRDGLGPAGRNRARIATCVPP